MSEKVWVDLTHPFSAEIPRWPYFDKPAITSKHSMAKGGVLTQNISCTMHTGTHCDVPRHVMEKEFDGKRSRYLHEFPVDAFCGTAVCLDLHFVKRWELIGHGIVGIENIGGDVEKVCGKPFIVPISESSRIEFEYSSYAFFLLCSSSGSFLAPSQSVKTALSFAGSINNNRFIPS